jgi:hypothetical protein
VPNIRNDEIQWTGPEKILDIGDGERPLTLKGQRATSVPQFSQGKLRDDSGHLPAAQRMAAKLRPRASLPRLVWITDTRIAEARGRQLQRLVRRRSRVSLGRIAAEGVIDSQESILAGTHGML